jgi:hypothetical protein
MVVLIDLPIQPAEVLGERIGAGYVVKEVVAEPGSARHIRRRIVLRNRGCDWINLVCRNSVFAGFLQECFPVKDAGAIYGLCCWIVESLKAGEVAAKHCGCRDVLKTGCAASRVDGLVVIEVEEDLVLPDRTANRKAEVVVALVRSGALTEAIIRGVERIVLEVFVACSVEPVGAAFTDLVEDCAADTILS